MPSCNQGTANRFDGKPHNIDIRQPAAEVVWNSCWHKVAHTSSVAMSSCGRRLPVRCDCFHGVLGGAALAAALQSSSGHHGIADEVGQFPQIGNGEVWLLPQHVERIPVTVDPAYLVPEVSRSTGIPSIRRHEKDLVP